MWRLGVLVFAAAVASAAESEFRGRVVCLPEEMHRVHKTDLPARHEHIYGFRAEDGSYYTLLRTKLSEALFMDDRLREKDLLLKGKVLPKSQILDVTHIKSIHKGVVHELYYYCDICAIESVSPVECACCQGPVELIEKPLSGGGGALTEETEPCPLPEKSGTFRAEDGCGDADRWIVGVLD